MEELFADDMRDNSLVQCCYVPAQTINQADYFTHRLPRLSLLISCPIDHTDHHLPRPAISSPFRPSNIKIYNMYRSVSNRTSPLKRFSRITITDTGVIDWATGRGCRATAPNDFPPKKWSPHQASLWYHNLLIEKETEYYRATLSVKCKDSIYIGTPCGLLKQPLDV